jgi:hypothetical protein
MEPQGIAGLGLRRSPRSARLDRSLSPIMGLNGREAPIPDRMGGVFRCCNVRVLCALPGVTSTSPSSGINGRHINEFRATGEVGGILRGRAPHSFRAQQLGRFGQS